MAHVQRLVLATARVASIRSVAEQLLRSGQFEARRTGSPVTLLIFWRSSGEVRQLESVVTGHDGYGSGLRDRRLGHLVAMQPHPLCRGASISARVSKRLLEAGHGAQNATARFNTLE